MSILSPFQKIKFEEYSLSVDGAYEKLVKRVFSKLKVENHNGSVEIPFPLLSEQEVNVWKEYCPNQRELKDAAIALHSEALKLIEAYGEKFDVLEVWYEAGDQVDPILIGKRYDTDEHREKKYSWYLQPYLLCRWGEALKPFHEIKQQVYEAYLKRERVRLQTALNNIEMEAMTRFGI